MICLHNKLALHFLTRNIKVLKILNSSFERFNYIHKGLPLGNFFYCIIEFTKVKVMPVLNAVDSFFLQREP